MKKILYNLGVMVLLFASHEVVAKKIKFAVDMTGQTVSVNGVHVAGDFQTLAGYAGGDWNAATTVLTKEGSSSVYSITINLPALRKYEYKFVNGDQFYEAEFVPEASRVGYNFNDNRWIYIDSLSDDTTFAGAILFGGNAPARLILLRLTVDLNGRSVSNDGVHLAATFNAWNNKNIYMYSFEKKRSEVIQYLAPGMYEFKYVNGEMPADVETVPSGCAKNGSRFIDLKGDTVLPVVCLSECAACVNTGIASPFSSSRFSLYPNPASGISILTLSGENCNIMVSNMAGRVLMQYNDYKLLTLDIYNLPAGIYIVSVSDATSSSNLKLVIQ